jgi:hypothetical protein
LFDLLRFVCRQNASQLEVEHEHFTTEGTEEDH